MRDTGSRAGSEPSARRPRGRLRQPGRHAAAAMREPLTAVRPTAWVSADGRPHPRVWHEAAPARVGHRLGMRVERVDTTGVFAPCPSCGLDETTNPEVRRARAVGLAALAGPVAGSLAEGAPPRWREDGNVSRVAAQVLASSAAEQSGLMREWRRELRRMLDADRSYVPLVRELAALGRLTGGEFDALLREVGACGTR